MGKPGAVLCRLLLCLLLIARERSLELDGEDEGKAWPLRSLHVHQELSATKNKKRAPNPWPMSIIERHRRVLAQAKVRRKVRREPITNRTHPFKGVKLKD